MMEPFPVLFLHDPTFDFLGFSNLSCGAEFSLLVGDSEMDPRDLVILETEVLFRFGDGVEGKVCSWASKDFGILDLIPNM